VDFSFFLFLILSSFILHCIVYSFLPYSFPHKTCMYQLSAFTFHCLSSYVMKGLKIMVQGQRHVL
jgi:hypothetical protein